MNPQNQNDFSTSLLELFRTEAENQTAILTGVLLELERHPGTPQQLQTMLRAAHSLKGAARIVDLPAAVRVAHAMEDCFVAAQSGKLRLNQPEIDLLLRGVDLLVQFSSTPDPTATVPGHDPAAAVQTFVDDLEVLLQRGQLSVAGEGSARGLSAPTRVAPKPALQTYPATVLRRGDPAERVLRLTAENLNRLLALAGESLVESRWLRPFSDSLQRLKRLHTEVARSLEALRQIALSRAGMEQAEDPLVEALERLGECQQFLSEKLEELDLFDRRAAQHSHRLYLEVLRARMRPFGDGVRRFPRMVRDLARTLGKEVRLEILGEYTQVDRDILERLESPLAHLLRNAVDHGCELPEEREAAGKPAESTIQVEAHHSAGMLVVSVTDDGPGIDESRLRQLLVERKMVTEGVADKLGEVELLEYLFLPGLSLKPAVTEISGRGVGLDVVQNMVRSVRGTVRISSQPARGTRFQLQLPLTLSVLRTLLVLVGGEPYAIPLSQISRTLRLGRDQIRVVENRHFFTMGNQQIGLLMAHQVLDCEPQPAGDELAVVVIGGRNVRYGLVVDRFLGERELVVQPLDPRLGKVRDINAAAIMEDGAPVLIIDVEDLLDSIERLISSGVLSKISRQTPELTARRRKRVLAVEDSLTVRELQRKLLAGRGYVADVAVDGLEAWESLRNGQYDLVITDIDMPRMDGIELTRLIKQDTRLRSIPVIIVSYKDLPSDRLRGLEAGVDCYLTKGGFHDETLLQAVGDLIGGPES